MNVKKWSLLFALSLALLATGCAPADKGAGQPPKTDIPVAYSKNCAACHGNSLEGRTGPDLTKVGARLSQEQIRSRIEKGGPTMPGFEKVLTGEEITTLSTWLAAKK